MVEEFYPRLFNFIFKTKYNQLNKKHKYSLLNIIFFSIFISYSRTLHFSQLDILN